jgi:hypothetical protein
MSKAFQDMFLATLQHENSAQSLIECTRKTAHSDKADGPSDELEHKVLSQSDQTHQDLEELALSLLKTGLNCGWSLDVMKYAFSQAYPELKDKFPELAKKAGWEPF